MKPKEITKAPKTDFTLDKLPHNGRILLYGSGDAGLSVLNKIRDRRPDIKVVCFLDSFDNGAVAGLRKVKLDDLPSLNIQYDFILITSAWWRDIVTKLEMAGISDYGVASLGLWHKYVYTHGDMIQAQDDIKAAKALLNTDKDKTIFQFLVDGRCEGSSLVNLDAINSQIVDYPRIRNTVFSHLTEQYLDFIQRDTIKTILHAGVFDGMDCLKFLGFFPGIEAIHGFEPWGNSNISRETLKLIEQSGKVHIHPMGLWHSRDILPMTGHGACATLRSDAPLNPKTKTIHTISIDEFVMMHRIKRVDYICLDIEGAEAQALVGAKKTITEHRPNLAVSIYHKKEDIFRLPLLLNNMLKDYIFHIGHYCHFLNETILYAIPVEQRE
ncbi:FkbM family methyltransferase [Desulfobacter vibrioformis]|uniref:FkbM family methyltransferase n=1 Tax=Desulfobacter vibrioformis TaxID=34031 RepID=UPI000551AC16|nr:FkbM family methyltransferase [Desulfobacter vibrioformis]